MTTPSPGLGRRAVAMLLAAAAVLPACSNIPLAGPVVAGPNLQRGSLIETVQQRANPPGRNAGPEAIVRGFLAAGVDYRKRHEVAREFLSPGRAARWEPGASVLVTSQDPILKVTQLTDSTAAPSAGMTSSSSTTTSVAPAPASTPSPGGTLARIPPSAPANDYPAPVVAMRIVVPLVATVDRQGRYLETSAGTTRPLTFRLERRGGQWRIIELPDGIVLGEADFISTFSSFPVYFPDVTGQNLIPDLRWFPAVGDSLATVPTALVSAMLEGPSTWLDPVVSSGAPAGTRLGRPAVLLSEGLARVDLTEPVRQADGRQRQRLLGQLRATLLRLPLVNGVAVTVDDTELDLASSGDSQSSRLQLPLEIDPRPDPSDLVFVSPGAHRLAQPSPDKGLPISVGVPEAVPGVSGLNRADVSHPAVDSSSATYAALLAGQTVLEAQPPGARTARPLISVTQPGARLSPPSFDPQGWVWSTSSVPSKTVTVASFAPGQAQVAAGWLAPYSVISLRISRDGNRAAIAARRDGHTYQFVAPIVRRLDGRPTEIGAPVRIAPRVTGVKDLAWADDREIVMVADPGRGDGGRTGSQDPGIWLSQIGGMTRGLGQVSGADSITAANASEQIYVGTDDGQIFYHPGQWVSWTKGRWPAMPG